MFFRVGYNYRSVESGRLMEHKFLLLIRRD